MASKRPFYESGGRRKRERGFTLLELLIATALAATLLLALWSLFSIYTNLFETGQTKVERAQLARSLLDRMADDLKSAIQDPIAGRPAKDRTETPLKRFALYGSAHELRVDVLQVTPIRGNPVPVNDAEQMSRESSAARVPELRTVYYTFQEPLVGPGGVAENLPGLVRRERDFETPYAKQDDAGLGRPPAAPGTSFSATATDELAGAPTSPESPPADLVDDSVIWVPEVVRLDFRYFDGNGWTSEWNSLERKSLPVAVEVALEMRTVEQPEEAREPSAVDDLDQPQGPAPDAAPVYRLVVDLPGSPKHPAPKRVRPVTEPRPAPRRVRRLVPKQLRREPKPTPEPLADQWMRREP